MQTTLTVGSLVRDPIPWDNTNSSQVSVYYSEHYQRGGANPYSMPGCVPRGADGQVLDYKVISGQDSPEMMQHLDRIIYFSVFQPATMFGKPTNGHMVLSLRRITVRG